MAVNVLGMPINAEAKQAAYALASFSGSKEYVEEKDLKGSKIKINGVNSGFNYETVKNNSNKFGEKGGIVTRKEFACRLQQIANITGREIVILLKTGQRICIKPFSANKVPDAYTLDVERLISCPQEDVPDKLSEFLKSNFTFEDNDVYLDPKTFYELKKGDCNDFALFSHMILSRAGYKPRFFIIFWPQETMPGKEPKTHDICVYIDKRSCRYNYFAQRGLRETQSQTLPDLFTYTVPNWNKAWELKVVNGQVVSGRNEGTYIYREVPK